MKKSIFPLAIFFAIGLFLRVWQVGKIPISLFGDEIDVGLQAYSILTTGKDYLGNRLPVLFHSFSEYRLPMQLYMDVPFIKLLGVNELGVRAPSVLMGLLTLIFTYLLVRQIGNKKLALIATLFMLFSPWHFNFSRQANDAGILLPFILAGTWSLLKGLKNYNSIQEDSRLQSGDELNADMSSSFRGIPRSLERGGRHKYLVISGVLFALSIYAYAISSLFTPLFVASLFLIYRKEILKHNPKYLFVALATGVIILLPYINQIIKGTASSRYAYIYVLNKDDLISEVIKERKWSDSSISKLYYNKYTVAAYKLTNSYLQSFSTDFMFASGDPNSRQAVSGFGMMYHYDFILVILGGYLCLRVLIKDKKNKAQYFILVVWLLLAPIPSVLTKGGGSHASRLILMLPPLIFLSAKGFEFLISKADNLKFKVIITVFVLIMIFDVGRFIHRYFVIWPSESWRIWQYGFKEMLTDVKKIDSVYERIYFNNTYEPILARFLFWYQYDMELFQKQFTRDVHIEGIQPGFNGFSLGDKYYFGELVKPIEPLAKKGYLVIASGEHDVTDPSIFKRSDLKLLNVYYSPTEVPIFFVYTTN